jgi:hypothetical protein
VKLARMLFSLVAIIVAIVLGLRIPTEWYGEVLTEGARPVAGFTTTTSNGKFSMPAGKADSTERVVVCKRGFEPAVVDKRPARRRPNSDQVQGSIVQLVKENPDVEAPYVASLRSILPSECR